VLESTEMRDPDPTEVQRAVLLGLRRLGAAALPWSQSLRQWQARVELMRARGVPAPEQWPDLGDEALMATLEEWAPPWIEGLSRREHFARMDLGNALRSRLSYAQTTILDREARRTSPCRAARASPSIIAMGRCRRCRCGCKRCSDCRDARRGGRSRALVAEIALARGAPGAGDERSRELLESGVPRGAQGPQGAVSEALLAGRPLHGAAHAARSAPLTSGAAGPANARQGEQP